MKSSKYTYAVMGATGYVGYELVRNLLKKGYAVRAIGRDSTKLSELKRMGAETYSFSFDSAFDLTKAFMGATAVFTMLPYAYTERDFYYYEDKASEAIATAISKSGVKYVVNFSSIGAQHSDGTGFVKAYYKHEQRMNKIPGINVLHLRAPFFMENFFYGSEEMENKGSLSWSYRKDLSVPFVSGYDIAKKVEEYFEKMDFTKYSVFELYGPEYLTFEQVVGYFSKSYKRPIRYKQYSYVEDEKAMISYGMNPNAARMFIEYNRAMNDGRISYTQKQSPYNTCTTTFNTFTNQHFAKRKEKAAA